MKKIKIKNFLENFILIAILLVIVQIFLHEFAIYSHWSVATRDKLVISGFIFDLIFTIEFIVRTTFALKNKTGLRKYWFYERGWVDFLSSIPLLLLDSGPALYIILTGTTAEGVTALGVLNVLKVVKAIRVTRILRLVRIIKIFGKIHNAESPMAQHHTATISTIAVFSIVLSLVLSSAIIHNSTAEKIKYKKKHYSQILNNFEKLKNKKYLSEKKIINLLFSDDENILFIKKKNKIIFQNIDKKRFKEYYSHEDFATLNCMKLKLYISTTDLHRDEATNHIESFVIIIFVVLAFMLVYTRHFVQYVSDIIHILNKGFRKKDYNLEVKMKDGFENEEIFRLAKFYNDYYLPAKHKQIEEETNNKKSTLSMDDLIDF